MVDAVKRWDGGYCSRYCCSRYMLRYEAVYIQPRYFVLGSMMCDTPVGAAVVTSRRGTRTVQHIICMIYQTTIANVDTR